MEQALTDQFLVPLSHVWADHTTAMIMIRDILMYMVSETARGASMSYVYSGTFCETKINSCLIVGVQSFPLVIFHSYLRRSLQTVRCR